MNHNALPASNASIAKRHSFGSTRMKGNLAFEEWHALAHARVADDGARAPACAGTRAVERAAQRLQVISVYDARFDDFIDCFNKQRPY